MRYRMLSVILVMTIGLAACGESDGDTAAEQTAGDAVEEESSEAEGTTVTVRGVRMSSGKDAELPADFPKDVYLPPRYKLESVIQSADTTTLGMTTGDAYDKVFASSLASMKSQGWTQDFNVSPSDEGTALAHFTKDGRRAALAIDDRAEEDTMYTVETGAIRK